MNDAFNSVAGSKAVAILVIGKLPCIKVGL